MKVISIEKKKQTIMDMNLDWDRIVFNTTRWACICFGTGIVMTEDRYIYRCRCEKGLTRAEKFPRYPKNIERI